MRARTSATRGWRRVLILAGTALTALPVLGLLSCRIIGPSDCNVFCF